MTDTSANTPQPPPQSPEEPKIFSEDLSRFIDALECLYIFDNLGGRLQFLEQYPGAAHYVFPAALLHFDQTGTKDKDQRLELEKEADENRTRLLENITTIQEKYKSDQALTPADIEHFLQNLGRELGLLIFDITIVDRFLPAPPEPKIETPQPEPPPEPKLVQEPDIKPISTMTPPTPFAPNLAAKRTLIHTDPPGSNARSYQDILKNAEKAPINPQKNQYSALFNAMAA